MKRPVMGKLGPAELGELFEAHAARLTLYARQWLDLAPAEDAVQEVFLKLAAIGIEPRDARAWLYRAVRNAAISAMRSQSRRARREREAAAQRETWFEPNPARLIDAQQVQEALSHLPAQQREIIVLRIWAGMTLAEVSATVELPLSTVHDQYRAALRAVRERMDSPCSTNST